MMLIKVAKNSTLIFVVQVRSEENKYQMVDEHRAKCYLDVPTELEQWHGHDLGLCCRTVADASPCWSQCCAINVGHTQLAVELPPVCM